jgi:hypothetical protein
MGMLSNCRWYCQQVCLVTMQPYLVVVEMITKVPCNCRVIVQWTFLAIAIILLMRIASTTTNLLVLGYIYVSKSCPRMYLICLSLLLDIFHNSNAVPFPQLSSPREYLICSIWSWDILTVPGLQLSSPGIYLYM